ncbi:MAG: hypothetical protein B7X41_11215 [Microbacterium sp. 14-71-5]|jgi:hypothetical protein|uniref:hypothetical protein n=1 Tax=Microbacterium sp. 13-71-7 TaxID=1970399 RepID=UPI000BC4592B|nr:hypothetical protein [Microbacterium sp. 13-71-7]OZB83154.1 MAG: hypothetical protein B7X32_11330 [Microbacterium sp. 13-71-7]OZB87861.1 MAG: hypothetical protein B7X41_11215 [Microbacterium sp. 14-71-5]
MTMMTPDSRFELRQVAGDEWIISDHQYDAHDERSAVACIFRTEEGCEVTWLVDFGLPTRFVCPANVVEDLRRALARRRKPIPIPHFAPPAAPVRPEV